MKTNLARYSVLLVLSLMISGCSSRLVDFTTISSKNVDLGIDKSQGIKVEGNKTYVFGFGWNLKDALDLALEESGPEYNILMDGVVRYTSYFVLVKITVEGTAYNSDAMRVAMGDEEFEKWVAKASVYEKRE